ncbi:MAG: DUF3352 domain-containing protein, partial [Thermodesulfobacteriota bacterium]|nr:DUF3352 domain-containing protein [Thermodesulfobacteriota bacterium]
MMIVQCKQCNSRYRLDEAKLKKPATKVKCPKCQNVFSVSMEEPTHVPKPQSITPPISKGLAPQEKTAVPGKMHALKRIISILAVLLIIITAGTGGFYLYQEYKGKGVTKGREITSFIPGNPLVYLRLTDTERHWSQFKKTRFYHQMINLPFWGDLKEIPGLRRLISGQGEWQGNIDLQIKENDIMEALGRDLHFAMYYPKNTQLPEALLITETTGKIKFLEILNQLGKKLKGKMASLTQETYQGQEINTVESIFGILNLYYTSFGGTFVISNTAGMIKKVIDLNKSTTPAPNCLKTNRIFQQAVKSLPPHRYGTFYLNYQVMLDFFNHLSAFKTEEKDQFKSFQQNFKPFKAMAAGLVFDQGIILKNCFFIHRKNLNHHQKTVFGLKPHRHLSLELMPQSTLFYLSMNSLDAPSYFSLWQEQMGLLSQKDQIPKINLEYWKDKLGINFEEKVLPLLGKEISLGI